MTTYLDTELRIHDAYFDGKKVKLHAIGKKWSVIVDDGKPAIVETKKLTQRKKITVGFYADGVVSSHSRSSPAGIMKPLIEKEIEFEIPVVEKAVEHDDFF